MLKTTMNKIVIIKLREKKYNQSTTFTLRQLVALNKSMRHNFKEWKKKKKIMHEKLDESIERWTRPENHVIM